jgi:glutamate synthase (NADPH/NADH) small chain
MLKLMPITADLESHRLSPEGYAENFSDLHPPLDAHQAAVEADRCYFCHDAPCVTACPTGIDIPAFIQKIATGNLRGSAKKILDENIFGAMCARVCPTEVLCEEACVRNSGENKPVTIGLLQRFSTDHLLAAGDQIYAQGPDSGRRVAIVGAGPAGLACAHRLAVLGHGVTVFEAREKCGGLNEYGIAAYKVTDGIALREVDYILGVGGIEIKSGAAIGRDFSLADLRREYDAVFLGLGMGGVNQLGLPDEDVSGVLSAVDYIAELRQADDLAALPVGRRVVVVGGGMTAIDIACQTRRLGAEEVTLVYRRGGEEMGASAFERNLARTDGVQIIYWASPVRILSEHGALHSVEFEKTRTSAAGAPEGTGEKFTLEADMLFKAIGQAFDATPLEGSTGSPELKNGRITVDQAGRTSLDGVWAGGDCVVGGEDLTVAAVQDGKLAAHSIDRYLGANAEENTGENNG